MSPASAHRPDEERLAVGEHRREHGDNMAHDDLARYEMPRQAVGRILERDPPYLNLADTYTKIRA